MPCFCRKNALQVGSCRLKATGCCKIVSVSCRSDRCSIIASHATQAEKGLGLAIRLRIRLRSAVLPWSAGRLRSAILPWSVVRRCEIPRTQQALLKHFTTQQALHLQLEHPMPQQALHLHRDGPSTQLQLLRTASTTARLHFCYSSKLCFMISSRVALLKRLRAARFQVSLHRRT
jgi:hypothetical protein